jgi:hypothetical protein
MRPFVICLFLVFCVNASRLFAQQGQIVWTPQEIQKKFYRPVVKEMIYNCWGLNQTIWLASTIKPAVVPLPRNFYTQNMGAVCKMELKMQKQIKFPLFIRMGSKDYVDALEGKNQPRR